MKYCVIDGKQIENKEMLHQTLKEALEFPEWYGNNLDAMYDLLTGMQEKVTIEIQDQEQLEAHLGAYAKAFLRVLRDAASEQERIHIIET